MLAQKITHNTVRCLDGLGVSSIYEVAWAGYNDKQQVCLSKQKIDELEMSSTET